MTPAHPASSRTSGCGAVQHELAPLVPSGRLIVAANSGHSIHRVLFVVLAVLGGSGILIYLAMWIIVPNQPEAAA